MKKWVRGVIAIVIAILVNVLSIGGVILWCKHIDKKQEAPQNVESTVIVEEHLESVVVKGKRYFV